MRRALWSVLLLVGLALALLLGLVRTDLPSEVLLERYADEESLLIEFGEQVVHLKDEGPRDGLPILLLHGTFSSLHTWDGWVEALSQDHRVVRMDLPGFGLTGPHPQGDYSLQAHLGLFEVIRQALAIDQWVVAGNSLGAGYALAYAQHFPDRVEAVGLLNGGRIRFSAEAFEARRQEITRAQAGEQGGSLVVRALQVPLLRSALSLITPRFLIRYALEDVYGQPALVTDDLVERYQDLLRREGNRDAFIQRRTRRVDQSHQNQQLADPLPPEQLTMPILIQWGGQDRWIPPRVGEQLAMALPTSQLIVYPDLGHVPMEEAPDKTVGDFIDFLGAGILKH